MTVVRLKLFHHDRLKQLPIVPYEQEEDGFIAQIEDVIQVGFPGERQDEKGYPEYLTGNIYLCKELFGQVKPMTDKRFAENSIGLLM